MVSENCACEKIGVLNALSGMLACTVLPQMLHEATLEVCDDRLTLRDEPTVNNTMNVDKMMSVLLSFLLT